MDVVRLIVGATRRRRVALVGYDGGGVRTLRPHVVYRSGTGALLLDAVQVAGATSGGGTLPGWRALRLDRVTDVVVTEDRFDPSPDLDLGAEKYAEIIAHCLDPNAI